MIGLELLYSKDKKYFNSSCRFVAFYEAAPLAARARSPSLFSLAIVALATALGKKGKIITDYLWP
jgi:hypothetical protein